MVKSIREAESSIGVIDYILTEKQNKGREFPRSLYAVNDAKAGDLATDLNVKSIRPGFGLHPKHYDDIVNKKNFTRDVFKGERLTKDML
jgi:pseudaminic acid synthase